MSTRHTFCWLTIVLGCTTSIARANEPSAEGLEFFETKIRPVLVEHCYECHSSAAKSPKGGLLLDSREASLQGGDSGHAIVPNSLDESLIIGALRYESFEMPPDGQLGDEIIADFEQWIEMGAPDPRSGEAVTREGMDVEQGRQFWAFQPVATTQPPQVAHADWARNEIDRFLLAKQQHLGLKPVADADRVTLIRRLSIDLIGLPPTQAEIDAFVNDTAEDAYERLVDRLLESPHFGERWGRHWLDVVRYAESIGKTRNFTFPHAWRYRDYVIDAYNRDLSYDQFIIQQLAGDLLPADSDELRDVQRIATGFLAIGSHDLNENNNAVFDMDVIGEQIDVLSRSIMALTLGCARCHDHKFDPIPTHDYYALAGIFRSTELLNGYANRRRAKDYVVNDQLYQVNRGERQLPVVTVASTTNESTTDADAPEVDIEALRTQLREMRQQIRRLTANEETLTPAQQERLARLRVNVQRQQKQLTRLQQAPLQPSNQPTSAVPQGPGVIEPLAMGVRDAEKIVDCAINIRGDAANLGDKVPRGYLQVVSLSGAADFTSQQSGRLELAQWLVRDDHPLTARVYVNRVWHHLFGRGLVRTVDNFGQTGDRPSHPELLDYLASRFMQEGWSTKRLIREIVTSRTYGLSSDHDAAAYEIDPDNITLWRMNRRRLEAEVIRDAILLVSGRLVREQPQASLIAQMKPGQVGRRGNVAQQLATFPHRSVYLPIVRSRVPEFLVAFDFPEPSDVKGSRDVTTVATQALFMMNSPFVQTNARAAAANLVKTASDGSARVRHAYQTVLGREPSDDQVARTLEYVEQRQAEIESPGPRLAELEVWTEVLHALMASAEFRYQS